MDSDKPHRNAPSTATVVAVLGALVMGASLCGCLPVGQLKIENV